jgi:hypothetical protein
LDRLRRWVRVDKDSDQQEDGDCDGAFASQASRDGS